MQETAENSNFDLPIKAYKNLDFLNGPSARPVRMLCEYIEPQVRFEKHNIRDTIVFFGSARTISREEAMRNLKAAEEHCEAGDEITNKAQEELFRAQRDLNHSKYYEDARKLAHRLTEWATSLPNNHNRFAVCSGGGPGIMEAANRGAIEAGGPSIGLNISLPMEQNPNPYQTPELSFEFHYFFIRKFWFIYLARALLAFPGGFGTMDELFELLTLLQTGKTHRKVPIVVYGTDFWQQVLRLEPLEKAGVISKDDLDLIRMFDDVDSAFEFLRDELTQHFIDNNEE